MRYNRPAYPKVFLKNFIGFRAEIPNTTRIFVFGELMKSRRKPVRFRNISIVSNNRRAVGINHKQIRDEIDAASNIVYFLKDAVNEVPVKPQRESQGKTLFFRPVH